MHATQDTPGTLAEQWPGWHVYRSTSCSGMPSGWCAVRREPLSRAEEWAGLSRTLVEDTPEALTAALRDETRR